MRLARCWHSFQQLLITPSCYGLGVPVCFALLYLCTCRYHAVTKYMAGRHLCNPSAHTLGSWGLTDDRWARQPLFSRPAATSRQYFSVKHFLVGRKQQMLLNSCLQLVVIIAWFSSFSLCNLVTWSELGEDAALAASLCHCVTGFPLLHVGC